MKVNITTKLDRNIDDLSITSPLLINEKVVFFLENGYTPDEYGYLHKGDNYIKVLKEGISIINKKDVWVRGIAKEDIELLHVDD